MRSGIGWQQWRDTHWKWIPGRAALARNDRWGEMPGMTEGEVIRESTKVMPDSDPASRPR